MREIFESLRAFNFAASDIHLWIFKRSTTPQKFNAHYVQTDQRLNDLLLGVVQGEVARITEYAKYTYLAQTNENSCLATLIAGSDFENLKQRVDRPEPDCRVRAIKDLKNAEGYVVKFVHEGKTVYAVKKAAKNWKTSYLKTRINLVFSNGELSAAEDNAFSIERTFDFYAYETGLFIASKQAFESSMRHRASYAQAFVTLRQTKAFAGLFTNMQPLIDHVGTNTTHLKRMARIEEKSIFKRPDFLQAVKAVNEKRGWGLNFDQATQQIIPCAQTIKAIMQVLLDHRLQSEVTDLSYDVPDATQIE